MEEILKELIELKKIVEMQGKQIAYQQEQIKQCRKIINNVNLIHLNKGHEDVRKNSCRNRIACINKKKVFITNTLHKLENVPWNVSSLMTYLNYNIKDR